MSRLRERGAMSIAPNETRSDAAPTAPGAASRDPVCGMALEPRPEVRLPHASGCGAGCSGKPADLRHGAGAEGGAADDRPSPEQPRAGDPGFGDGRRRTRQWIRAGRCRPDATHPPGYCAPIAAARVAVGGRIVVAPVTTRWRSGLPSGERPQRFEQLAHRHRPDPLVHRKAVIAGMNDIDTFEPQRVEGCNHRAGHPR